MAGKAADDTNHVQAGLNLGIGNFSRKAAKAQKEEHENTSPRLPLRLCALREASFQISRSCSGLHIMLAGKVTSAFAWLRRTGVLESCPQFLLLTPKPDS